MARLSFKNKKKEANNAKKQRGIKRKFGGGLNVPSSIYTTKISNDNNHIIV